MEAGKSEGEQRSLTEQSELGRPLLISSQAKQQKQSQIHFVSRNQEASKSAQQVIQGRVRQRRLLFSTPSTQYQATQLSDKKATTPIVQKLPSQVENENQAQIKARLYSKVIPKEIGLESVISEEEDGIMSTGGAHDEDGINQSIVYPSSIHSVKRKLDCASNEEEVNAVAIETLTPSNSNQSRQAQQPTQLVDCIYITASPEAAKETPGFLEATTLNLDSNDKEKAPEQFISVAQLTESEVEVNFYSEGLSNHGTSYQPSCHDMTSTNPLPFQTVANSVHGFGSVLQSQTSEPFPQHGGQGRHRNSGVCQPPDWTPPNGGGASCGNQTTELMVFSPVAASRRQRVHTVIKKPITGFAAHTSQGNRLAMVNDLGSNNSTLYEGDTGGQRQINKSLVRFQSGNRREHAGSQENQRVGLPTHISPARERNQQAVISGPSPRISGGHHRIRSTEDATGIFQNQRILVSRPQQEQVQIHDEVINEMPAQDSFAPQSQQANAVNRPRKDSSGGTKPTRIEHMQSRVKQPATANAKLPPGEANRQLQRMLTPESEQQRMNLTKSVEEEYSPISMPVDQSVNNSPSVIGTSPRASSLNNSPTKQQSPIVNDAQLIFDLCEFLNRDDNSAPKSTERSVLDAMLSKEEQEKRQIKDQSVHSYYNKSNNSTPRLKHPKAATSSQSRQRQLFQYTVGTVASHQKYAATCSTEMSPINFSNAPIATITLTNRSPRQPQLVPFTKSSTQTQKTLLTPLRLSKIFNSIVEKTSPLRSKREQACLRKLAIYALCLIVLVPASHLNGLPSEFAKEISFFRDEVDNNNPCNGGKIQLNPIPEVIRRMISKDSTVIQRLRADGYQLSFDQRIWTYPKFQPSMATHAKSEVSFRQAAGAGSAVDPLAFAEQMIPDPHDYCIGVLLPGAELTDQVPEQRIFQSDMLFQLDARIDRELTKSMGQKKRSESPQWMLQEVERVKGAQGAKNFDLAAQKNLILPQRQLGHKKQSAYASKECQKSSIHASKETCKRTNNTVDTMMEVPDEGYNDIKDFTDVELSYSQNRDGPRDGSQKKQALKRKVPAQNPMTPGQSVLRSKIRSSPRASLNSKVPTMYTMKSPSLTSAVKSNWQRSITTITKYPQTKSNAGSGRKTATTKLHYGYAGMVQSEKRSSQEEIESMSQTAPLPKKISQTSQSNMTISSLIKSVANKTNLRQTNPSALSHISSSRAKNQQTTQRLNNPKTTESLENKKTVGTAQKSAKANSSRAQKNKISPSKTPVGQGIVAHHTRSFAITSSKHPVTGSFTKIATPGDSASRRRQKTFTSALNSGTISPAGSFNSTNYKLTQQLPQTQRAKATGGSAVMVHQSIAGQQSAKGYTTLKQRSVYQGSRAKTSLESHLMNRVMSSIRESSAGNQRQPQLEEEKKGTSSTQHQALITQNKQRRRQTELSQIIKLASDIKSANQPTTTATTTATTQRRRKTEIQSLTGVQKSGFQTERTKARTARGLGEEFSPSSRKRRIQEVGEPVVKTDSRSRANSSGSSNKFLEQIDEHASPTKAEPNHGKSKQKNYDSKPLTGVRQNESRQTNLNSQLQSKLMLSNQERLSQTPGTKVGGGKASMGRSPTDHLSSTLVGTNGLYSSRQNISLRSSVMATNAFKLPQTGEGLSGKSFSSTTPTPVKKHNLRQLLQPVPSSHSSSKHSITNRIVSASQFQHQNASNSSSAQKLSARSTTGGQPSVTVTKTYIQLF